MAESLPRLNRSQLPNLKKFLFDKELGDPAIGIVHFGLGNFHRAHQAIYTEEAMLAAGGDWGICGVTLLDDVAMQAALQEQDCLYTVLVRDRDGEKPQVIRSIKKVIVAPRQSQELKDLLLCPQVKIVSLTVTEKGYCYDPKTSGLDFNNPGVQHDLANPEQPKTAPGYLVWALKNRKEYPFTVLSCDNLAHNGTILRNVVLQFADALDKDLAKWIAENVRFPSTMVDRIAPATTDGEREAAAKALGMVDAWPVPCEDFRQWVIEDNFAMGRPAWEKAGAMLVDDVIPYELAKLRMLNGTHSTIAYLSMLAGFETVDEAIADEDIFNLIRNMMDQEVAPTLTVPDSFDRVAYRDQLLKRYANPSLKHKTAQISMDGSLKLPPRILGVIADRIAAGQSFNRLALAVAAWMRFLLCKSEAGQTYSVNDPMAERLTALAAQTGGDNAKLVETLLAVREIFPQELATNPQVVAAIRAAADSLQANGAKATARQYA